MFPVCMKTGIWMLAATEGSSAVMEEIVAKVAPRPQPNKVRWMLEVLPVQKTSTEC